MGSVSHPKECTAARASHALSGITFSSPFLLIQSPSMNPATGILFGLFVFLFAGHYPNKTAFVIFAVLFTEEL